MKIGAFRQLVSRDYQVAAGYPVFPLTDDRFAAAPTLQDAPDRIIISAAPLVLAGAGGHAFDPDQEPTTFLDFLSTDEEDEDSLVRTAQNIGLLHRYDEAEIAGCWEQNLHAFDAELGEWMVFWRVASPDSAATEYSSRSEVHTGETVLLWQAEIRAMREVWNLWLAANSGDPAVLSNRIKWPSGKAGNVLYDGPLDVGEYYQVGEDEWEWDCVIGRSDEFHAGDLVQPALRVVGGQIRQRIQAVTPDFRYDEDRQTFESVVAPRDLLSALWLQLADAVESQSEFRRCEQCGKWFPLPRRGGPQKEYCSEACRIKAAKKRRKERSE
jgi:hypothetical protein